MTRCLGSSKAAVPEAVAVAIEVADQAELAVAFEPWRLNPSSSSSCEDIVPIGFCRVPLPLPFFTLLSLSTTFSSATCELMQPMVYVVRR